MTPPPSSPPPAPVDSPVRVPVRVILLGIAMLASAALCGVALAKGWIQPHSVEAFVHGSGPRGMVLFIAAVILLELVWLPRVWGLVAGGVLFGPVLGGTLAIVADFSSAAISYFLARGAAHAWVTAVLARRPKAQRIVAVLAHKSGFATIALLRVCPVAHYTVVNYAAGVAGVRPTPFLLGTLVGLLPGAVLYPVLGDSLFRPGSVVFWVSLALFIAASAISFFIGRRLLRQASP